MSQESTNKKYFRPTQALVDLSALRHNYLWASELVGQGITIFGVVKANAYGHGAVQVSKVLESLGVNALAVATPEEGIELREAGLSVPILLLGGPMEATATLLQEYKLTPVLYNREQIEFLAKGLSSSLSVQLKIDSGMTRLGILPSELTEFLSQLARFPHLRLEGVLTHLAKADVTFEGETEQQYRVFANAEQEIHRAFPDAKIFHLANSAAILGQKLGGWNGARPGIMLYGANPHPRLEAAKKLKAVMSFSTEIISLKTVAAGTAVSYGGDWVAPRTSRIAVLPVGYADGYPRHLSNKGKVLIRGQLLPVLGRVCMDLTMVDVTDLKEVALGDKVLLWGPGLPAEQVAEWAGTIAYELFCGVSRRVPRVYIGS